MRAYSTVLRVLEEKKTTIRRLRRMLFGPSSEKSRAVLETQGQAQAGKDSERGASGGGKAAAKAAGTPPPGHGRNGMDAYAAATVEAVSHQRLKSGDRCPSCRKGKVYEQQDCPGILVS